jgi:dephospho-CoA kinase
VAALQRLRAQAPLADKVRVADYVIDGAATLEETRNQVQHVWERIRAGGPQR